MKIILDTPADAKLIFKNRNKLPNHRIKLDYTPMQQKHLHNMYSELQDRKNNGESDIALKFIKNVPTIIKLKTNKSVSPNFENSEN